MLGLGVGVLLLVLFFVPLVAVSGWIESMRKEMKTGFDDLDSRLKAIVPWTASEKNCTIRTEKLRTAGKSGSGLPLWRPAISRLFQRGANFATAHTSERVTGFLPRQTKWTCGEIGGCSG
jgi:hypothetical protein